MAGTDAGRIATNEPPTDPHIKGHLVSTGMKESDHELRLVIHEYGPTYMNHACRVYWPNKDSQGACQSAPSQSLDITIEEHGWFHDVDTFEHICKNHPVPKGRNEQETFRKWRDSLLTFLDKEHGGGQWTRIN
jgi:hypothetical protein